MHGFLIKNLNINLSLMLNKIKKIKKKNAHKLVIRILSMKLCHSLKTV